MNTYNQIPAVADMFRLVWILQQACPGCLQCNGAAKLYQSTLCNLIDAILVPVSFVRLSKTASILNCCDTMLLPLVHVKLFGPLEPVVVRREDRLLQ
jgi:hypothetical protein